MAHDIPAPDLLAEAWTIDDRDRQLAAYRAIAARPMSDDPEERAAILRAATTAAVLTSQDGDWDAALSIVSPLLSRSSESPGLAHIAAVILARAGRTAEALAQVERALDGYYSVAQIMEKDAALSGLYGERFDAMFAAWRKKQAYTVNLDSLRQNFPAAIPVPPLLIELGQWLEGLRHGAIGYFDALASEPLPEVFVGHDDAMEPLGSKLGLFLEMPDGSRLALWHHADGAPPAVVLLGSEGELKNVAPTLEQFLTGWAKGRSGIYELDDERTQPEALAKWLADRGIKPVQVAKPPAFSAWFKGVLKSVQKKPPRTRKEKRAVERKPAGDLVSRAAPLLGRMTNDAELIELCASLGVDLPELKNEDQLRNIELLDEGVKLVVDWPWDHYAQVLRREFSPAERAELKRSKTRMFYAIYFYNDGYREWSLPRGEYVTYSAYKGPLPAGIAFADSKADLAERVGRPPDNDWGSSCLWYDAELDRRLQVKFVGDDDADRKLPVGTILYLELRMGRFQSESDDEPHAKDVEWLPIFERGLDAHNRGDIRPARADYHQVLGLAPGVVSVHVNLGNMRWAVDDDLEAAIRWYDRALALDPDEVNCLGNRAEALMRLGRYEPATRDLERGLALQPRSGRLHLLLALCADEAGDDAKARKLARAGRKLEPKMTSIDFDPFIEVLRRLLK